MFTFQCTTCHAKLVVKNEELIGQILACPKCGGMVLVERPSEDQTFELPPEPVEAEASRYVQFPDLLAETESGFINKEQLQELAPPEPTPVLTDTELKTRKILLGILAGLAVLLVLAGGILVTWSGRSPSKSDKPIAESRAADPVPAPEKTPKEVSAPVKEPADEMPQPPVEEQADSPAEEKSPVSEPKTPDSAELSAEPMVQNDPLEEESPPEPENGSGDTPLDSGRLRSAGDLLAELEKKLPGLVESGTLPEIDITERLEQPISDFKLDRIPLIIVLRTLSRLTEIPMTLDIDEFPCRGIRIDEPVSADFQGKTIGRILTDLLAPFRLEPVVKDRQILITVAPEEQDRILEKTYELDDLAEKTAEPVDLRGRPDPDGRLSAQRVAEIVRTLIDPAGFDSATEPESPSIHVENQAMVLRHRLRMQDSTLRLLEQMRVVRNLPQKSDIHGEALAPEAFGWDAVDKPMTLNYYRPIALSVALDQVESVTGLSVLVDHRSLHRALAPLRTIRATLRCDRGTVNQALENLLGSIDIVKLDYRIVQADLIEITTRETIHRPEKMSVEVHRYETADRPLPDGETPEGLIRAIRTSLEPNSWRNADDPDTLGSGDVIIDRPSGCLFIRQSQPVQRQIRLWLGRRFQESLP